ncbi:MULTISPECIES: hypothetical protein [unclassified Adlercreutzia]|uniref:CdiA C-terminal domain-containing protein n=1 Tax=unclassified Adlercreutzia TaxID=2636013 RepID=UPI0013EBB106|nr:MULTISPECIES: hypothetical protein [unclassified Adlercreutzia]
MQSRTGKIIIPSDTNVWPHEMETAHALARSGLTVKFIRCSKERHVTSADVIIDGDEWEMKAPESCKLKMVERNLRRALKQSPNVIFDSRRMKGIPDTAIERELRKWALELKSLRRLILVNRHGKVIAIK